MRRLWNSNKITNLLDPVINQDASTKKYVDDQITVVADQKLNIDGSNAMTADFDCGNNKLTNIADGVDPTDGININQLGLVITPLITKTQNIDPSTSAGNTILNGNTEFTDGQQKLKITNDAFATRTEIASTNGVLDATLDLKGESVKLIGNNIVSIPSCDLGMSSNNIVDCADPINPQDVATKKYVDDKHTVVRFQNTVDTVLYEDSFVRFDWITADAQPSYVLKTLPNGSGPFPNYVDVNIQFLGGGSILGDNGDGQNTLNTKAFFNGGPIDSAFDHVNYGCKSICSLSSENDVNYPYYRMEIMTGDIAQTGIAIIEIF